MAQSGFTPIQLYYSTTGAAAPVTGNLTNGELAINITDGKLYYKDNSGVVQIIATKAGAAGTVTSVAQSFTGGIVSVGGSPITASGTLALTVAGTSGGVPYFSSASAWASSAALALNALVVGGGAGAAPATVTTGTGALTALGIAVGSAGAFVVNGGALGTPASGVATNLTGTASGLTAGNVTTNANLTGAVTSSGNATSLGSFTSLQLATALTDETGTGANVFATSPTLVTPALGTPSALVGTNITGTATSFTASNVTTNANLTGMVTSVGNAASLGSFTSLQLLTALTDETGTGANVFAISPTLVTPILGTPSSGTLTNCTADGTNGVGYLNIPQNSQSTTYTLVLGDQGKSILHPSSDTSARTFTIPANSSVAYPIGTAVTFVNQNAAGTLTIAITSDTMRLAGAGTTGSRTLTANGLATAIKLTSTEWIISGTNLT